MFTSCFESPINLPLLAEWENLFVSLKCSSKTFRQRLRDFPGRTGRFRPAPPQTRTSPIKAYGSSVDCYGFATHRRSERYSPMAEENDPEYG